MAFSSETQASFADKDVGKVLVGRELSVANKTASHSAHLSSAYAKIRMTQRLAWPLCKNDPPLVKHNILQSTVG